MENIEYSVRNIESKLEEITLLLRDICGKFDSSEMVEHLEEGNASLHEISEKLNNDNDGLGQM